MFFVSYGFLLLKISNSWLIVHVNLIFSPFLFPVFVALVCVVPCLPLYPHMHNIYMYMMVSREDGFMVLCLYCAPPRAAVSKLLIVHEVSLRVGLSGCYFNAIQSLSSISQHEASITW